MNRSIILCIDSKNRTSGTPSNFEYTFNYPITDVKRFQINKVIVPYSFYTIESQNFTITYDAVPYIIYFPGGNYNNITLSVVLQNLINSTIPAPGITIVYDSNLNKYQVDVGLGHTFQFDFSTPNRFNYNLGVALGWVLPSNVNEVVAPTVQAMSPYQSYLAATKNIFVKSQQLRVFNTSYFLGKLDNVLQTVPIRVNAFDFIEYENPAPIIFYSSLTTFNQIDFQLVDDYDNIIELQGYDWSLEIEVFTDSAY